jgi:hypothetical protein
MMTVMLTCNDANALIVRTIDDALSGGERAALRRHLVSCAHCRDEYETQHGVRRLLVLHLQDRLPDGFDERLRARLAQASRPLPALAFGAMRRDTHGLGRTWAVRLIPLAATLALIVAGTSMRDDVSRPASVSSAAPGQPRVFTTVVLPRTDRALRRHRSSAVSPISAEDVALAPTPSLADDGERHAAQAVTESAAVREHESRAAKVSEGALHGTSAASDSDRVPSSEPRGQERGRVASREGNAGGERAASQRPGILPRPAPIPHARPAMPAPPAVGPDRTIPPP